MTIGTGECGVTLSPTPEGEEGSAILAGNQESLDKANRFRGFAFAGSSPPRIIASCVGVTTTPVSRGRREGERAAFEPTEVEGEAVAHPGQNLELVPALVLEHEQIARQRIAKQDRSHHAGERVDPLAAVDGVDRHVDAPPTVEVGAGQV